MSLKNKIQQIIEVIQDSNIDEIEITSFWGAQKIKLKKNQYKKDIKQSILKPLDEEINIDTNNNKNYLDDNQNEEVADNTKVSVEDQNNLDTTDIKAPLVGTFYASSKPDEEPFINKGEKIKKGDPICIIEAMKIFNTIESEFDGEIVEIFAVDGDPVEFGQSLFSVKEN